MAKVDFAKKCILYMYIYMWWGVGTFEGVCPGLPDDIQHGWPYTILLPCSIRIHLQYHMLLIPATYQKFVWGTMTPRVPPWVEIAPVKTTVFLTRRDRKHGRFDREVFPSISKIKPWVCMEAHTFTEGSPYHRPGPPHGYGNIAVSTFPI